MCVPNVPCTQILFRTSKYLNTLKYYVLNLCVEDGTKIAFNLKNSLTVDRQSIINYGGRMERPEINV